MGHTSKGKKAFFEGPDICSSMLESGAAQTKLQRDERDALTRQQQIGFSRRFYGSIGSKSTERTKLAGEPLSPSPSPSSSVSLGFLLAADHGSTNNENICCIFNIILTLDEIVSVFTKIIDHQLVSYAWCLLGGRFN